MANFHELVKEKRLKKGYSQNQMAKMLHISQAHMNQIENGVRNPSFEILNAICTILGIKLPWEAPKNES